ncbi:MAG: hypothetical protein ACRC9V_09605, partial [Aeromonas sp.]
MKTEKHVFECPDIEPLLERIECLVDKPAIKTLLDLMAGAPAGSPAFNLHYWLAELISNTHMLNDLYEFAITPTPPQYIINRCGLFCDTLD